MPPTRSLFVLALILLTVPAALASPLHVGPYVGVVKEGEARYYTFILNPYSQPCHQVEVEHVVTLVYSPPTDTLTFTVNGQTVVGQDGVATISFPAVACTWYDMKVAGTKVASVAAFDIAPAVAPDA